MKFEFQINNQITIFNPDQDVDNNHWQTDEVNQNDLQNEEAINANGDVWTTVNEDTERNEIVEGFEDQANNYDENKDWTNDQYANIDEIDQGKVLEKKLPLFKNPHFLSYPYDSW